MSAPEALDMFDRPGSIGSFKPAEHNGQLVLIWPLATGTRRNEKGDEEGFTEVNVVVLDAPGGAVKYEGVSMFQRYLQARIRNNIGTGRASLGRISQKPPKKATQSPYWDLDDPTDSDITKARTYMANPNAKPAGTSGGGETGGGFTTSNSEPPF
jgi:hypothetical protein